MRDSNSLPGALLAIPGDLATPTGGYAYARILLERARANHVPLHHWPLPVLTLGPDGMPDRPEVLAEIVARLDIAPTGWPIVLDGLVLSALPPALVAAVRSPVVALIHHPLALETGLSPEAAERLAENEAAVLAECAGVIATSATTATTLAADYGVPRYRITVAQPGTEKPVVQPGAAALIPKQPALHLLSIGSLIPRKGHDLLIEALAALPPAPWHLTIVGGARDLAYAAQIEALIAHHGFGNRITLTGEAAAEEVERALVDADIFVLASHYEGYGMAYTEAVAAGLPVIGTEGGAIAEATMGAARLVPPGDLAALTEALHAVIGAPDAGETRAALRRASQEAAARLPGWDQTLDTFLGALAPFAPPASSRNR
ncbi:MAG: glycosyltransferase family 4 protein [Pseudomonadota bacterium]